MTPPRKLKSGAPAHDFTDADRSKGGRARAEKLRAEREAAKREADARTAGLTELAVDRLEDLLRGQDPALWPRAIKEVLDRVLGRPAQRVEVSGHLTHGLNLRRLSDAELEQLEKLMDKAAEK